VIAPLIPPAAPQLCETRRMAHLWHHTPAGWIARLLTGERELLADVHLPPPITLRTTPAADWLLLAPAGVILWINARRVHPGIRRLQDRDELRLPGAAPVYFSTELRPHVAAYPGSERAAACPRCRQPLTAGAPAVRCPACGTWHHESPECNCWTYAAVCACCAQPTALDADYRWRPEDPTP
jgi:hypothetical protein